MTDAEAETPVLWCLIRTKTGKIFQSKQEKAGMGEEAALFP